ncbi:hypothetical protein ACFRJ1_02835 [Streptomyces sp. NPDC056773]|uniref:hypothetical protein n=1 Tax=unclassified Streptomyces TaxID=2593676 RepID=UPI0036914A4B
MSSITRTQLAAAPAVRPATGGAPSRALAVRDLHDNLLKGLARVPFPEEGARRAARVGKLRRRLEQLGGWLMSLPAHPDTDRVLDQVIRWQDVQPRNPAQPDDRFAAALECIAERAERHLNQAAVGLAYAMIPPGTDDRRVLAVLQNTAHRFCGQAPLWRHDHGPTPGYARPALRSVLELAERRRIHVLLIPSLDHLPPDDPRNEEPAWTLTGIWDQLRGYGIRLVTADHDRPLSDHDVEDWC